MLECKVNELEGVSIASLVPKEILSFVEEKVSKRMAGDKMPLIYETILITKNGNKIIVEANGCIIQYKGRVADMVVVRDITERKKAEEALKRSEEDYRLLIENMGEGIGITDENEIFIFTNPAADKIFGVEAGKLTGVNLTEFMSAESLKKVNSETHKRIQGESSVYELDIKLKDGRERTILISATPRFDNKKFSGTFGIFRDITEDKKADALLQDSKALTEAVVENVPLMIFLKESPDLRFVLFNKAGEDLLGLDRNKLYGHNDLDFFPPDQASFFMAKDREILDGETGILDIKEEPINTANKGERILHTRKVCIRGADGKTKYLLGISEDITEQKKAEEEIKLKNQQLQAINAEKDKFFSIIAHDLRSPFAGFLKLTNSMVRKLNSMPIGQIQQLMELMNESASNLYSLLENLLEWANIKRGRMEFRQEMVSLTNVVNQTICLINESSRQKDIAIKANISEGLEIYADLHMAESILRNLITNAVKFTAPKGKIFVSAKTTNDNQIEISIEDNGVGMSQELQDNLFKIDSKVIRPGTDGEASSGLGLLLCKEFVEKNGGKISVVSEEGKGSKFSFTMPASNN